MFGYSLDVGAWTLGAYLQVPPDNFQTRRKLAPLQTQAPNDTARIAARSRRQAMDWSLVLLSQGIETTVMPPGEDGGWALLIPARDSERAFQSLRQYRLENRGWPWRREFTRPQTHFHWGSAGCAGLLILFYWLSARNSDLLAGGIMDSHKVFSGEWWRVFTAMTLHENLAHLSANLALGIVLLGMVMGQFGPGTGLLAAYLAGLGGNLVSLLLNPKPFLGLGASGMVMGALGLLAAQSLRPARRAVAPLKYLMAGVAAAVMLFILFGLSLESDIAAHLGGFVAGFVIGAILVNLPPGMTQHPRTHFASVILLTALVTSTWLLALHHTR